MALGGPTAGGDDEFLAVGDTQLGEHTGQVGLDRLWSHQEFLGDLRVRQPLGDELSHTGFGGGERIPPDGFGPDRDPEARRVLDGGVEGERGAIGERGVVGVVAESDSRCQRGVVEQTLQAWIQAQRVFGAERGACSVRPRAEPVAFALWVVRGLSHPGGL